MESTSSEIKLPPERLKFRISAKTEADPRRPERNEDSIAFNEKAGYAMVLDGVGSSDGLRGSSEAKSRISRNVTRKETDIAKAQGRIRKLIRDTSAVISDKYGGMAQTTLVIIKLIDAPEGQKALIASVGDSRAYRSRGEELEQITADDDLVIWENSAEDSKKISEKLSNTVGAEGLSEKELGYFNRRNAISQSIGSYDTPQTHFYQFDIQAGDRFVLTSDGIHDNLTNDEISRIVQKGGRADQLVQAAKTRSQEESFRSKRDDMSAVVVEVSR